ncbi:MAG: RDD family protein [Candidatus Zixiibacteriota bacterium]|jgi:uncharacterized RDD family membrane protein YckC
METKTKSDNRQFAGLWPRLKALVLDFALLSLLFFPVTRIVKGTWIMSVSDHRWASGWFVTDPICLVFLAMIVLYFILLEGLAGATPGKMAVGIRVVSVEGKKPGLTRSIVRNVLRVVDSLPVLNILGVVLITKSPERARFGDRVAGTRVIKVS